MAMEDENEWTRQSGQMPSSRANGHGRGLYRLNSNQSSSSIFEDVEMAHEEVGHRHLLIRTDILTARLISSIRDLLLRVSQPVSLPSLTVELAPIPQQALSITTRIRKLRRLLD